jgi:hypothetical protein
MTADATGRPVTVRPLARADLARLSGWLAEPHVARWWRDPNDLAAVTATAVSQAPRAPSGTPRHPDTTETRTLQNPGTQAFPGVPATPSVPSA